MPQGLVFPFDFGFIPSTLGEDGDPLDVLILMDEPMHVDCLVDIRLIGVMEAEQTEKSGETVTNDRLIGIAVHSHQQADVNDIREINRQVMHEIEIFSPPTTVKKASSSRCAACAGQAAH
jgi:inorganic pyrophosphatase